MYRWIKLHKQNQIIWNKEANAWFERNKKAQYSAEIISAFQYIFDRFLYRSDGLSVLEFGCADGRNGAKLQQFNVDYIGVEPSEKAVRKGINQGLNLQRGMAQTTVFPKKFDVIILGFFLYLTPKSDWISILKNVDDHIGGNGYIIIKDFFSETLSEKIYSHDSDIQINKFNFSNMFLWHPDYIEIYKSITSSDLENYESHDSYIQTTVLKVTRKLGS